MRTAIALATLIGLSGAAHAGFFLDSSGYLSPTCAGAASPKLYVDEWGRLYGVGASCTLNATTYATMGRVDSIYLGTPGKLEPGYAPVGLHLSTGKTVYVSPSTHKVTFGKASDLGIDLAEPLNVVIPGVHDFIKLPGLLTPDVIAVQGPDVIATKWPLSLDALPVGFGQDVPAMPGVAFDTSTPDLPMTKYAAVANAAGSLGLVVIEDLNGSYVNEFGMVFAAGADGWGFDADWVDLGMPAMIDWTVVDGVVNTTDEDGNTWEVGPEGLLWLEP
jgi:hypothetical protein